MPLQTGEFSSANYFRSDEKQVVCQPFPDALTSPGGALVLVGSPLSVIFVEVSLLEQRRVSTKVADKGCRPSCYCPNRWSCAYAINPSGVNPTGSFAAATE